MDVVFLDSTRSVLCGLPQYIQCMHYLNRIVQWDKSIIDLKFAQMKVTKNPKVKLNLGQCPLKFWLRDYSLRGEQNIYRV